jgi:hypothetical protein
MLITKITIGFFFIWFIIMSSYCSELMSCNLQKYIRKNNWVKHIMIFLSIYIFTFVLDWYSLEQLVVEKYKDIKQKFKNKTITDNYLFQSLIYTLIIYVIFLLSTKNEGIYLFTFIIGVLFLTFAIIITKSLNAKIFTLMINKGYFITAETKANLISKYPDDAEDINKIAKITNIILGLFLILLIILIIGTYKYYLRQYSDHHKNWSWFTFWIGNHIC